MSSRSNTNQVTLTQTGFVKKLTDIVVGDDDGVIIIPASIAKEVADEAYEMTAYESFVIEQVQQGATIIGLYPATKDENLTKFAEWRKKKNIAQGGPRDT